MGATQADLSLGVGAEIARPALRPRLAGEARHLHKKQVPRARGPQAASSLRRQGTPSHLNFCCPKLFPYMFMLSIIVGLVGRANSAQTRPVKRGMTLTCDMKRTAKTMTCDMT
jgi:hypothetical protein